jgi:hypothetical protein
MTLLPSIQVIFFQVTLAFGQDVIDRLVNEGLERDEIVRKGWLDVKPLYEAGGWKVEHDSSLQSDPNVLGLYVFAKRPE